MSLFRIQRRDRLGRWRTFWEGEHARAADVVFARKARLLRNPREDLRIVGRVVEGVDELVDYVTRDTRGQGMEE
jgi:hypothetical protein